MKPVPSPLLGARSGSKLGTRYKSGDKAASRVAPHSKGFARPECPKTRVRRSLTTLLAAKAQPVAASATGCAGLTATYSDYKERRKSITACLSADDKSLKLRITAFASDAG